MKNRNIQVIYPSKPNLALSHYTFPLLLSRFQLPPQPRKPAQFQAFAGDFNPITQQENIGLIMDVPLDVTVELGRTSKSIQDIRIGCGVGAGMGAGCGSGCGVDAMEELSALIFSDTPVHISFANEIGYNCIILLFTKSPISIRKEIFTN